jgi:hypothetical protein
MIGIFLNLQGQKTTAFYPGVGDTGILGTVVAAWKQGGGLVRADANQSAPNSGWQLAPCSGPQCSNPIPYGNPLELPFAASYTVPVPDVPGEFYVIAQDFCVGTRVSFDVLAGPYANGATNVQAI